MIRPNLGKLILSIILILIALWASFKFYNGIFELGSGNDVSVPDIHGKTAGEAKELLEKSGLVLAVSRSEFNNKVPKDTIINQDPDTGMRVKRGRTVQVVVSSGPQVILVPDFRGLDVHEALIQLENNRLKSGAIQYVTHPIAKEKIVVDQSPLPGKSVMLDSAIDLTVSAGPPPEIVMPRLTGHNITQAKTMIQDGKLRMGQVAWKIDPHEIGEILIQNPPPSSKVHEGDMVSIVVSAGEKTENLPFKQSYITIVLPNFDGKKEVSVWVTDETSTNLVYRGVHFSGEKIELMVSGFGNSKVEVYLGNRILSSGQL